MRTHTNTHTHTHTHTHTCTVCCMFAYLSLYVPSGIQINRWFFWNTWTTYNHTVSSSWVCLTDWLCIDLLAVLIHVFSISSVLFPFHYAWNLKCKNMYHSKLIMAYSPKALLFVITIMKKSIVEIDFRHFCFVGNQIHPPSEIGWPHKTVSSSSNFILILPLCSFWWRQQIHFPKLLSNKPHLVFTQSPVVLYKHAGHWFSLVLSA